jgi:gliding motility-associated-like protein
LGTFPNFATFCLNGFTTSPQQVVLHWIGLDGVRVCSDTILFDCDPPPPPTCVSAVKDSIWCDGAQLKYTFSVTNAALNTFPVKSIVLSSSNPNITASQTYFVFTPAILPGQTSGSITVNIGGSAAIPDSIWCFYLTAHNNIIDTLNHIYPTICCTDSVQVHCVTIPDCTAEKDSCCNANNVSMPTGFSPNNDNINDIFEIRGISKCKQINLTVFNRWGNIVYQQVNYSNTWDGTNQNGNPLPQGTYYIMVDLIDSGSTVSGFVDLRRY